MSTPGTSLYVNADWSALVPMNSPEAAFGLDVETARRLGLLDGPKPPEPVTIRSANLVVAEPAPEAEPEAEVKEAPPPANKQAAKPANKAARKPRRK